MASTYTNEVGRCIVEQSSSAQDLLDGYGGRTITNPFLVYPAGIISNNFIPFEKSITFGIDINNMDAWKRSVKKKA